MEATNPVAPIVPTLPTLPPEMMAMVDKVGIDAVLAHLKTLKKGGKEKASRLSKMVLDHVQPLFPKLVGEGIPKGRMVISWGEGVPIAKVGKLRGPRPERTEAEKKAANEAKAKKAKAKANEKK